MSTFTDFDSRRTNIGAISHDTQICGLCRHSCSNGLVAGEHLGGPIRTFNTGVDDAGNLLPGGAVDPHYTLISSPDPLSPGPNAFVVAPGWANGYPLPPGGIWLAQGPSSNWIAPKADQSWPANLQGYYTYRTTFDLTGFYPSSAVLTGRWTSDDFGVDILINGISTGINYYADATFTRWTAPWEIRTGFKEGLNTLDFVVANTLGLYRSPTGLRVEISGWAQEVPEPSSVMLLLSGEMVCPSRILRWRLGTIPSKLMAWFLLRRRV